MAQQRVIRVFVSSTFRDMQAEREELVKRVFPQLRKLCEGRGVTWGEVDLRWGVTDEQKAEGKVLPICLAEIYNCRPYFIGLLGERYGWIPDEIPQDLVEREPWLAEHRGHSVTELEILHGVLRNPDMAQHAFFYFRNSAYVDALPPEKQSDYREVPSPEEVQKYGAEEATRRAGERRQKLLGLKRRIRGSGFPVREDYADPKALGERVLADLTEVINRLFPEDSRPDPLDREVAEHEAFAASRARVYIGRQDYFDRLNAHTQGDGPPLVLLGESGSGKSALLANWVMQFRANPPTERPPEKVSLWKRLTGRRQPPSPPQEKSLVLMHFIGATPQSADWAAMLRRIMGEFKRRFDIQQEIPDQPDALRAAFANSLHMVAAKGRVVLILDGLNQLEDRDQAPDLVWLPPEIPANVRLILSTLPGRALDDLKKRGWPTLVVEPLTPDERKRLIVDYLAQYTKALSPAQVERLATANQTANPLFLRALLEELRVYGDPFTLNDRIKHYLSAATVDDLYERILERYEQDYEGDRAGLVREAMSLLWAARRGLSEAEVRELLGRAGEPLPRAHWSPLYLAAEQSLVSRSGLIGFFHDYLRKAVEDRYLPDREQQQEAHLRLAGYFEGQDLGPRKVDELPYQLSQAEAWERLSALLTDLPFFTAAWDTNRFEVSAYWARVEGRSPLRLIDAYRPVLNTPGQHNSQDVWRIADLLGGKGYYVETLPLHEHLVKHFRELGNKTMLGRSLGNQAEILYAHGDLDEAMRLFKEQENICRELGDKTGLLTSLGNQGVILLTRQELRRGMGLFKEQERICRELGDKVGLCASLGNQALILKARGALGGAMRLLSGH
ncbi:MAG: hypothetical protein A3F84_23950 [Candidatus Handelsmanbacteria bacterium RIFCSPLOWO2_12_FULL_64_10]|uniref:DUF4062 domain-containing protein n=1 Tax=Handelsmanbacteria sp. (strain RIFCSPLOWO2_12_FULL_64_10) TaxID=1817868 RepID=A0A1F6CJ09_HANXR|nr:MAG: hypothetical protein A3F84_23950 [Candidatus Handelsmanbacteria bacterium RIFCSPLOWO2_12_FULL_64_10]